MTSMRERMARALSFSITGDCEWTSLLDQQKQYWNSHLDAILSEMETPSDDVISAGEEDGGHSFYRWSAMIRAIRDGK